MKHLLYGTPVFLVLFAPAAVWACGPSCSEPIGCFALYSFISLFLTWVGALGGLGYLIVAHRRTLGWIRMIWYATVAWVVGACVTSLTFVVIDAFTQHANNWIAFAAYTQAIVVQIALMDFLRRRYQRKTPAGQATESL